MGVNALNTTTKEQVFGVTVSAVKGRHGRSMIVFYLHNANLGGSY